MTELSLRDEEPVSWQASAGSSYLEQCSLSCYCSGIFSCVIIKTIYHEINHKDTDEGEETARFNDPG